MKKSWGKPVLLVIYKVKPEEAVLSFCKSCDPSTGPGSLYAGCYSAASGIRCLGCSQSNPS